MMAKNFISTNNAPPAFGPFCQGLQVGNMLFTSAQLGIDPQGNLLEGVEAQTRQSLSNIDAILTAADFARTDVVKATVYITDMNDFSAVNAIYAEFFGGHKPARACVEISRLAKDALVEIDVIAIKE